jgi:hypothetical protein
MLINAGSCMRAIDLLILGTRPDFASVGRFNCVSGLNSQYFTAATLPHAPRRAAFACASNSARRAKAKLDERPQLGQQPLQKPELPHIDLQKFRRPSECDESVAANPGELR